MTTLKSKHGQHHSEYDLYDDVEQIKAALMQASQNMKGRANEILSDSVDDIKKHSSEAKDSVANYAAQKPFQSLGIALLAGIAIGYFLRK